MRSTWVSASEHHHVDRVVVDREGSQVAHAEVAVGHLGLRDRQHRPVGVDAGHLEAASPQVGAVAARAAGRVECDAGRQVGEYGVHRGLVHLGRRVGPVVARRPGVVAVVDAVLDHGNHEVVGEPVEPLDDAPDVVEAGPHGRRFGDAMAHRRQPGHRREVLRRHHLVPSLWHARQRRSLMVGDARRFGERSAATATQEVSA
jgi:hypothetical protein